MMSPTKGLLGWLGLKRDTTRTPTLGQRELAVLNVLWQHGSQSAQQVLELLGQTHIGLSTVQSTLERLYRKDLLYRKKTGRAFYYRAKLDKTDLVSNLLRDIADELASGDMEPIISGFMNYLSTENPELESKLSEIIRTEPPPKAEPERD